MQNCTASLITNAQKCANYAGIMLNALVTYYAQHYVAIMSADQTINLTYIQE